MKWVEGCPGSLAPVPLSQFSEIPVPSREESNGASHLGVGRPALAGPSVHLEELQYSCWVCMITGSERGLGLLSTNLLVACCLSHPQACLPPGG